MIATGPQSVTDFQGFAALRADARSGENRDANLDAVAKQFESLFINMMLKQMRQASQSTGGGLMDSDQSRFYRDMYDQQISVHMAGQDGVGLAPAIRRQLGGESQPPQSGRSHAVYQASPVQAAQMHVRPAKADASQDSAEVSTRGAVFEDRAAFVRQLRPHAEAAARSLGVPARALLAQAALESGWGRAVMQRPGGDSSHNLFGIKADQRWDGDRVSVNTLEYRDGIAMKTRAEFRAYDSVANSFADYAAFIGGNPRYGRALAAGNDAEGYVRGLQQAGYATDPAYADKIIDIMQRPEFAAMAAEPLRVAER